MWVFLTENSFFILVFLWQKLTISLKNMILVLEDQKMSNAKNNRIFNIILLLLFELSLFFMVKGNDGLVVVFLAATILVIFFSPELIMKRSRESFSDFSFSFSGIVFGLLIITLLHLSFQLMGTIAFFFFILYLFWIPSFRRTYGKCEIFGTGG